MDFSKLHTFAQSTFSTWKYYVEDDQLRLTFGADVYDTYQENKVDGIVLEFYDLWGFAGSLEISDKKSYSGVFNKIIPLNSKNALSVNKINENLNALVSSYKRNVNIFEEKQSDGTYKFKLNGKEV